MPSSEAAGCPGIRLRMRWLTTLPPSWPVWRARGHPVFFSYQFSTDADQCQANLSLFCWSIKNKFSEYTPAAVFDDLLWRICSLTNFSNRWGEETSWEKVCHRQQYPGLPLVSNTIGVPILLMVTDFLSFKRVFPFFCFGTSISRICIWPWVHQLMFLWPVNFDKVTATWCISKKIGKSTQICAN